MAAEETVVRVVLEGSAALPPCEDAEARAAVDQLAQTVAALPAAGAVEPYDDTLLVAAQGQLEARVGALEGKPDDDTDEEAQASLASLADRVGTLEARPVVASVNEDRFEYVRGFDTAAVKAAVAKVWASRGGGSGARPAMRDLYFPAGVYTITENDALLPWGNGTDGYRGMEIAGSGMGSTHIRFAPNATSAALKDDAAAARVGNLMSSNKAMRQVTIRDLTVESLNPDASFLYAYHDGAGDAQNQGCRFENINLRGSWKRVFGFDGGATANLNSEMTFSGINGATAIYRDAMFKVGGISGTQNQQNQFLDYWFHDSFFILGGGTLFDVVKGGNLHVSGGSWSSASGTAPAMRFVHIGPNYNNLGAAQFSFDGVRFEPKAANHRVFDVELGHGTIGLRHCTDQSSIQNTVSYDYPLMRVVGQVPWGAGMTTHPNITLEQCHLAGYISYEGDAAERGHISVLRSHLYRGNNHALAVPTTNESPDNSLDPYLRWTGSNAPRYRFTDCNTERREYVG